MMGKGYLVITIKPNKGGRHFLLSHMNTLSSRDVLVLDRGYLSYLVLNKAMEKVSNLICRIQSGNLNKLIQSFLKSDEFDDVVTHITSVKVLHDIKKQLCCNPSEIRSITSVQVIH